MCAIQLINHIPILLFCNKYIGIGVMIVVAPWVSSSSRGRCQFTFREGRCSTYTISLNMRGANINIMSRPEYSNNEQTNKKDLKQHKYHTYSILSKKKEMPCLVNTCFSSSDNASKAEIVCLVTM